MRWFKCIFVLHSVWMCIYKCILHINMCDGRLCLMLIHMFFGWYNIVSMLRLLFDAPWPCLVAQCVWTRNIVWCLPLCHPWSLPAVAMVHWRSVISGPAHTDCHDEESNSKLWTQKEATQWNMNIVCVACMCSFSYDFVCVHEYVNEWM